MQAQKTLIVALVLVALGAACSVAAECEIYKVVAAKLVPEAAELLPEGVVAIVEAGDFNGVREAVEVHVTLEERRKARVFATVVRALGKAALKGVANLIRVAF